MPADPYRYFRVEARELAEQLEKGILELEREGSAAEVLPRLLRAAHTLKGAARVVRQREIAEAAHALEDALGARSAPGSPVASAPLLAFVDSIRTHVLALGAAPGAPHPVPDAPAPTETIRADVAELDQLLEALSEGAVELSRVRGATTDLEHARRLSDLLSDQLAAPRAAGATAGSERAGARASSLAEELRTTLASIECGLTARSDAAERELRLARETAEHLRLVPADTIFAPLARAAHDVAAALGRTVRLEARGGEVRIDAHVLASLQPALLQLVRNAVAHGAEAPAERRAAGKPPEAAVTVALVRRGGRATFSCADDGRGIDLDAVQRAAHERGLLPAGARPGEAELLHLLGAVGLSTSRSVTEVSGRGVGLDVVRHAVATLGGAVELSTTRGKGTRVELSVPVSRTSIRAIMVEAEGVAAAVPLEAVRETIRVPLPAAARGPATIAVGAAAVPFAPLARALRLPGRSSTGARPWTALVVSSGDAYAAVGVDRLLGAATIVARPVPAHAALDATVAGAALDAAGDPQLLLDAAALVAAICRSAAAPTEPAAAPQLAVLVIDDSLTTRMLEQSILESAGYEVDLATSGEEALVLARRRAYALFLVDVEMPGMTGFEFLERARSEPALAAVPSILVTSRDSPEDRQRGQDAGAAAYVVKSEFDQARLLATIRELV